MPDLREKLEERIRSALESVLGSGTAGQEGGDALAVRVERPRVGSHGDFSTNAALVHAKAASVPPRDLASAILDRLELPTEIESAEVAGPGFLNFTIRPEAWGAVAAEVLESGPAYGKAEPRSASRIDLEFVSANPTGPMHLGHARWAAWGDSLGKLLETAGFEVTREFYINDAGNQIDLLGKTIAAQYLSMLGRDAVAPEDGYKGAYIADLAERLVGEVGDSWGDLPREELERRCAEWGSARMLEEIKAQLERLGVVFDVWTSEKSVRSSGRVEQVIAELRKRGLVEGREGATWFLSTKLGDDKDRVLVKSDGEPTYLAVDIAYHVEKFERGFDRYVNIWGADHAGHVPKLKMALEALGLEHDRLEVILGQLVSLSRAGEPVRMSKRSGDLYTFEELVDEIGPDAARFHFLMQGPDTALHLDVEKAVAQSLENPVYYVQYAHARICSILRKAGELGLGPPDPEAARRGPLETSEEVVVLKRLEEYPYVIREAAALRAPHKLTAWARELSAEFHAFYQSRRVLQAETPELVSARLALVGACRQAIANCLSILGVSAPERMEKLPDSPASADQD